jgi:hypothetical protein
MRTAMAWMTLLVGLFVLVSSILEDSEGRGPLSFPIPHDNHPRPTESEHVGAARRGDGDVDKPLAANFAGET